MCEIKPLPKRNEAIKIPAKVAFSSFGVDLPSEIAGGDGIYDVAASLVSYEYLWGEVRVKGGAYGTGMGAAHSGLVSFYSFRDPTPKRTIDCYRGVPDFLDSLLLSDKSIDKYIIGAIGDSSPYLTPRSRANVGTLRYLSDITPELRARLRGEILSANPEKLKAFADDLREKMDGAVYCIIAPKDKIETCEVDAVLDI